MGHRWVWGLGWVVATAVAACGGGGTPGDDASAPVDAFVASMDAGHDAARVPVDAGPRCQGVPHSCDGTTDARSCAAILGCGYGLCAGAPVDCHRILDRTGCLGTEGCSWDGAICTGTPATCGSHSDATSCAGQPGCTYGTSATCSGTAMRCDLLTSAECETQPGCVLGTPDAFVPPPDAWTPPPPDAWVAPPDVGCTMGSTTTSVAVHTVEPDHAAGGVRDLAGVHVRAESACGGTDVEAVSDSTGHLTLDLADGGAPWAVTFAIAGHSATSVLDVTRIGFDGDVRLETLDVPADARHVASGSVTGTLASGHHFLVDCPDFETTTPAPGGAWSSGFYTGHEMPDPPLLFVALDLDASGRATNLGSVAPRTRPTTDVSGVTIAMPSPAATAQSDHVVVHLPSSGLTSGWSAPTMFGIEHAYLDIPYFPYVVAGTGTFVAGPGANDLQMDLVHFPGALDVDLYGFQVTAAGGAVLNVWLLDPTTHTETIPAASELVATGTSLGELGLRATGSGWDALVVHIGETPTALPRWRVIADASSGMVDVFRIPHLPTGVTLADIGLVPGSSTTALPILVVTNGVRPWTARGSNVSIWQYRYALGGMYQNLSATGR